MQHSLFDKPAEQTLDLGDEAYIQIKRQWVSQPEANSLLRCLINELHWEQPDICIGGRLLPIPRLQSWYGDEGAILIYSGRHFKPNPWHPMLIALRDRISAVSCAAYNSVLANQYRDGNDSVGWHADDEPELGDRPTIASLSLGSTRKFLVKPKSRYLSQNPFLPTRRYDILLAHGDLLIMSGASQKNWQHSLPKTKQPVGQRINLTFRNMLR